MPFPSEGHELGPHNLIEDVRAFLDTQYRDKYYVYNLSQRSYDVRKFHSRVRFYTVDYLNDDCFIIGNDVCIRLYYHYSVSLNLNIMIKRCVLLTIRTLLRDGHFASLLFQHIYYYYYYYIYHHSAWFIWANKYSCWVKIPACQNRSRVLCLKLIEPTVML